MLIPGHDGASLVVCGTCRGADGVAGGGAALLAAVRDVAVEAAYAGIAVETMACLWSCAAGSSVQLRSPGKIGYVLGRMDGDVAAARALLDFAVAYAASTDGEVPFARWPKGVLGHFIARIPPPAMLIA